MTEPSLSRDVLEAVPAWGEHLQALWEELSLRQSIACAEIDRLLERVAALEGTMHRRIQLLEGEMSAAATAMGKLELEWELYKSIVLGIDEDEAPPSH